MLVAMLIIINSTGSGPHLAARVVGGHHAGQAARGVRALALQAESAPQQPAQVRLQREAQQPRQRRCHARQAVPPRRLARLMSFRVRIKAL